MPHNTHPEEFLIGEVTAEPHCITEFYVGLYEDVIPQPTTRLEYNAVTSHFVQASLVRMDNHGEYTLVYYLQNNGDTPCDIKVYVGWQDDIFPTLKTGGNRL